MPGIRQSDLQRIVGILVCLCLFALATKAAPAESSATLTNASPGGITNTPRAMQFHLADECTGVCFWAILYLVAGSVGVILYVAREMKPSKRNANDYASVAQMQNVRLTNLFFLPMFHLALSSIALYFCWRPVGTALVWAVAWFSGGTLLGFIFGIPKYAKERLSPNPSSSGRIVEGVVASPSPKTGANLSYETNNNLVEVSDWLTKIVVGLGLVNLQNAPEFLRKACGPLKTCFGDDCYLAFGIGLILGFSTLGFLFGNVFTRLFLARAIAQADPSLEQKEQEDNTAKIIEETKEITIETVEGTGAVAPLAEVPWAQEFAALAQDYEKDQFSERVERVRWKDNVSNKIGRLLTSRGTDKKDVTDFVAANPSDGSIAGLATYCVSQPEERDVSLLLRVAALARRLHTRYRLILAFRALLRHGYGARPQLNQIAVLIQGWLDSADDSLRTSIAALRAVIEEEYARRSD